MQGLRDGQNVDWVQAMFSEPSQADSFVSFMFNEPICKHPQVMFFSGRIAREHHEKVVLKFSFGNVSRCEEVSCSPAGGHESSMKVQ